MVEAFPTNRLTPVALLRKRCGPYENASKLCRFHPKGGTKASASRKNQLDFETHSRSPVHGPVSPPNKP